MRYLDIEVHYIAGDQRRLDNMKLALLPTVSATFYGLSGFMNHHNGPVGITAYNETWHFAPGSVSAVFCPSNTICPNGTSLALDVTNTGISMNDIVPGGQQVYVTPEGKVKYTLAHEEGTEFYPDVGNKYLTGVTVEFNDFPDYNYFRYQGGDFYGCPSGTAPDGSIDYVVYVTPKPECEILTLIVLGDTTDVWQFD